MSFADVSKRLPILILARLGFRGWAFEADRLPRIDIKQRREYRQTIIPDGRGAGPGGAGPDAKGIYAVYVGTRGAHIA
jgi:hypothetical protein